MNDRKRLDVLLRWGLATIASTAVVLSIGLRYGVENHASYLVGALKLFDPELFARDWLASETTLYHPAFSYVGWLLLKLSPTGWGFGIANVVAGSATLLFAYWIAVELVRPRRSEPTPKKALWIALGGYLLLMSLAFIAGTRSVAVSYILGVVFQPSSLGSLGLLAGMGCFVGGRWLASGLCVAFGGFFHANFLLLSIPMFGIAHLVIGREGLVGRLVRQFAPVLLVFLFFVPLLLESASSPDAEAGRDILFKIRSAHHYDPTRIMRQLIAPAGWMMLGVGLGPAVINGGAKPPSHRRVVGVAAGLALVVWGGTVLTTAVVIPQVIQLFVWRFAPFSDMIFQLIAFVSAVRLMVEPSGWRRVPPLNRVLAVGGLCVLLITFSSNKAMLTLLVTVATPVAIIAIAAFVLHFFRLRSPLEVLRRHAGRIAVPIAVLFCIGVFIRTGHKPVRTFKERSTLIKGIQRDERQLYQWAREQTPKDTVFLTPPHLDYFRVHAQRAIIVDWKTPPILGSELVEWRRRLAEVAGRRSISNRGHAVNGYRRMTKTRLEELRKRYGFSYVVLERRRLDRSLQKYPQAYKNRRFIVLNVQGAL